MNFLAVGYHIKVSTLMYFFNHEKSHSLSKSISSIRLSSGEITDDPTAVRKHVRDFYQNLYSQPQTDEGALNELLTT